MAGFTVMFSRFPFGASEHPDVTDWLVETVIKCKFDSRISAVRNMRIDDTPITASRNRVVEGAKAAEVDYLVMIDSDMKPDAYLPGNPHGLGQDDLARPFWDSSWEFMLNHRDHGPCMIGVPYCGPPPHENVYVFTWATFQSDHPNVDLRIEPFAREAVVNRRGFEEVACLPTGLVLIDMRVFDNPLVVPPYFDYEWKNKFEMHKASTEDCFFTRDLNMANIPLYVNWDSWAGHWKRKCVGKPTIIHREQIARKFRDAVLADRSNQEHLLFVNRLDGESQCKTSKSTDQVPESTKSPSTSRVSKTSSQDLNGYPNLLKDSQPVCESNPRS